MIDVGSHPTPAAVPVPGGHIGSPSPMTDGQRAMAVAIARDILAQLDRDDVPLMPVVGHYVYGDLPTTSLTGDLQGCVDTIQAHCTVCMLGAAMLSKARLFDRVPAHLIELDENYDGTATAMTGRDATTGALADVFDRDTLDAMESAFERAVIGGITDYTRSADAWMATDYGDAYRMRRIANNLIDHGGRFVVPLWSRD